jgi:phage/conjugal plasmid C-4 type zinc finger TraR family protein
LNNMDPKIDRESLKIERATDFADVASNLTDAENARIMAQRGIERQLEEEIARERAESGVTEVFCEECGNEIPAERLKAVPHAKLCVGCKSVDEFISKGY